MGRTIARSNGLAASLTQTYGYVDPANRLASAGETGGWAQTYNCDAFGNRTVSAGGYLPNSAYTPQGAVAGQFPNNQWVRGTPVPCGPAGNSGDQYDCAGNQTALAMAVSPYNQTASTFTYDGENRLLAASVGGQGGASFVYDGEGRRVQKITPSATTTYIHDAKGELAMEVSTAAPTASGTEYLTADTLGSTRLITDASGNPQRCIDYLPFGEEIPAGENGRTGPCYESLGSANTAQYPAPPDVADQKFTGKERDAETGLDFFGARYFSSAQGRFTSPDWSAKPEPIPYTDSKDPQSLNLYAYVRNNPLKNRDLDGHWCVFGVVGTSCTPPPPPPAPPPGPPAQLMQPNGGHQQVNYRPGVPPAAGHLQNLVQCIGECARTPLTVTSTSEHMEGAHGPDTPHGRGEAADLAARSPQQADHLVGCAAQCGAGFALNEVRHPSPHATGPHVHVQVGPGLGGSRGDLPAAPQEDQ